MRRHERGFSLVEMTVVLAIVSALMLIVYSMLEDTLRTTMFNESHNDLAVMTQRAVNTLQVELLQTRVSFEENTLGSSYRAALQIPASIPRWTTSLLPVSQTSSSLLNPDTAATRFTGNSLLLARQLAPLSVMYDHDANAATPNIEFLADRYRFEYFFLSPVASRGFANTGVTLDLLQSTSIEYADYFQLSSLSTQQLARVVPRIQAAGLTRAWFSGQPRNAAFFDLSGATDGVFNAAVANAVIDIRGTTSLLPGLRGGRITGKMDYSVAFVPDSPRTPFPLRMPINVYARLSAALPRFPAGFEVKIAGPAGNRQVVTRLLLMSRYSATTYESQQGFVTTAVRF
jgi:prepilin-type N-terminal cleavage/methylation domain-containing protein